MKRYLLLLLSISAMALPPVNKLNLCFSVARQVLQRNPFDSVVEINKEKVLEAFHQFRVFVLKDDRTFPHSNAVKATQENRQKHDAVLGRINAIEKEMSESNSIKNSERVVVGTVIRGAENIDRYLNEEHEIYRQHLSTNPSEQKNTGFAIGLVASGVAGTIALSIPILGADAVMSSAFGVLSGVGALASSRYFSLLIENDFNQKVQGQIKNPSQWIYDGSNYSISKETIKGLYTPHAQGVPLNAEAENNRYLFPFIDYFTPHKPPQFTTTDKLFYVDPKTQEPVLVVVFRSAKESPNYPKDNIDWEKIFESVTSKLRQLKPPQIAPPIPVRN